VGDIELAHQLANNRNLPPMVSVIPLA